MPSKYYFGFLISYGFCLEIQFILRFIPFQVFHICEGGKKISFLCPNGTIFQQTELICDWWFKVNCAASPGHYAESSEILSRARQVARDKDIKVKVAVNTTKEHKNHKYSKGAEESLDDNYDFEDIALPSTKQQNIDREGKAHNLQDGSKSNESQEFAASSSFVNGGQANGFNGYYYKQPSGNQASQTSNQRVEPAPGSNTATTTTTTSPTLTVTRGSGQDSNVQNDGSFNGYQYREPERSGRRFQTARPPKDSQKPSTPDKFQTTPATPVTVPNRGTTKYRDNVPSNGKQKPVGSDSNRKPFIIKVPDPADQEERPAPTTPTSFIRNEFTQPPRYETTRSTPFYTPTVPTFVTTQATFSNRFGTARPSANTNKIAEHAMEMMRTIKDLKLETPAQQQSVAEQEKRSGLVIPPSSGPQTLHSLALYFATAVDSLVTKPADVTTKPLPPMLANLDARIGNITKLDNTLVSEQTKQQYETLFGTDKFNTLRAAPQKKAKSIDFRGNDANLLGDDPKSHTQHDNNDLETEFSNNPIIAAAGTKQIRELAQVFTHALSAYLHDPSTFRKVLAEIRPTEPPPLAPPQNHNARNSRTKEFDDGLGAATHSALSAAGPTTTEEFEVLDFSDVTLSTPSSKEQLLDGSSDLTTTTISPTTGSASTVSDAFDSTRSQILEDSLKHIDHVPASRVLTQPLESFAINQYNGNSLGDSTTEPSNPLAIEINGGLSEGTTNYPYIEEFDNVQFNESTNFLSNRFEFFSQLKNSSDKYQTPTTTTEFPFFGTTIQPIFPPFDLMQPAAVNSAFGAPKNEILPPIDDDDLQRAHSQSIYGNGKNDVDHRQGKDYLTKNQNDFGPLKTKSGHYITEISSNGGSGGGGAGVTPNPNLVKTTLPDSGRISSSTWSTSYTVFLDPLTINDGLMGSNEQNTVTPSINTYLPQSTPTTTNGDAFETTTFASATDRRKGKAVPTTTQQPQTTDDYIQVMQRKANQMFGSLNDTSADHLMNVMKKADRSKTVRRLILLLVQTCDDNVDYNKTVEQTRKALLNALISMDSKIPDENELQIINANSFRYDKAYDSVQNRVAGSPTTSTQLPITTYHRSLNARFEQQPFSTPLPQQYAFSADTTTTFPFAYTTSYPTTTDLYTTTDGDSVDTTTTPPPPPTTTYYPTTTYPTTTTFATPTTTTTPPFVATTKQRQQPIRQSNRLAKDLDKYLDNQDDMNFNVNQVHRHSDARALELLRSLYSLAGRFGK